MEQYIAYHKSHNQGPYTVIDGLFWASSNVYKSSTANQMLGNRIWIIQAEGNKPFIYRIVASFILENVNKIVLPDFSHTFTGRRGILFDPGVQINEYTWFHNFRQRCGNFQRMKRLQEKDSELLEEITDLVRRDHIDILEIAEPHTSYVEGAVSKALIKRYERSPEAREKCIHVNGTTCSVCEFDFEQKYGALGKGFIHIHHMVPIASCGGAYNIDPVNDLKPVCPNCHAMLHRRTPPLSINELKYILKLI